MSLKYGPASEQVASLMRDKALPGPESGPESGRDCLMCPESGLDCTMCPETGLDCLMCDFIFWDR